MMASTMSMTDIGVSAVPPIIAHAIAAGRESCRQRSPLICRCLCTRITQTCRSDPCSVTTCCCAMLTLTLHVLLQILHSKIACTRLPKPSTVGRYGTTSQGKLAAATSSKALLMTFM